MTQHDIPPDEPQFITAMIDSRRAQYHANQTCTPGFLTWLDTTPRPGVGSNEAWNAGCADTVDNIQQLSLASINELAKVHCDSYASPHHITFSSSGLRSFINAVVAQSQQVSK